MTIKDLFSSYDQDTCAYMVIRDRRNNYLTINPAFYDETDPDLQLFHRIENLRIRYWWSSGVTGDTIHIRTDQLLPLNDHDLEVIYR